MRKISKFFAVVLCLVLMVSGNIVTPVYGAEDSPESSKRYKDAIGLLKGMEVWPGYIETSDEDAPFTRSQFAKILAAIADPDAGEYKGNSHFSDVSAENEAYSAINHLVELGLVSGTGGKFNPDDEITLYQASKLLVATLGYSNIADANGGYPKGYFMIAGQLGISEYMTKNTTEGLTKKNAVIMIYNSLFVGIQDIVSMRGDGNATYSVSKDKTLLTEKFDIYKTKGRITENSMTSLEGKTYLQKNEIRINDIRMNAGKTNAEMLLGYYVTVYYRDEDDGGQNTVVYITDIDQNEVLKIDAEDIVSFENGTYLYEKKGVRGTKRAKVGVEANFVYNERACTFNERYLIPKEGYVELIKDSKSGNYNTVLIHDIQNIVVNAINLDKKIVSGKYGVKSMDFDESAYDRLVIRDTKGNDVELDDIFEWDVISYTKSADEQLFVATVVREYITGKVTNVNYTTGEIDVEENEFRLSPSYPNSGEYQIVSGDKGDFLLDSAGKIAAFVKNKSGGFVYGYLIRAWNEDDGETVGIKILCADRGIIKNYVLADRIRLDGTTEKPSYSMIQSLDDSVVRYKLNDDGKVNEIDSTRIGQYENSEKSLFVSSAMTSTARYYKSGSVGGRVLLDSNTVVFVVPGDRTDFDKYKVKSMAFFNNNYSYAVEAYNTEKEYAYADAVLVHSDEGDGKSINYNTYMAIVQSVYAVADEDNQPAFELTYGIKNTVEKAIMNPIVKLRGSTDTIAAKSLTPGSVIRIGTDYQNRVNEIELLYLAGENGLDGTFMGSSAAPNAGFNDTERFLYGYVYLTKDGMIRITANDPSTMSSFDSNNTEGRILTNFRCMMLDTTGAEPFARTADQNDFLDYVHYGKDCVKVIVQTKNTDTYAIMIVK